MTSAEKILHRKAASKAELRQALADALGVPCPAWATVEGEKVAATCRRIFLKIYEKHTGIDYAWEAKDAGCLNSIVKKIYGIAKYTTDDEIVKAFKHLMNEIPLWYVEHGLSLCVINSKFNEIIAEIKRHGSTKKGKISDSYKQGIVDDLCS